MSRRRSRHAPPRRRWRPGALLIITAVLAIVGATVLAYSPAASWLSAYNQSLVISKYSDSIANIRPKASEQLVEAHRYNEALSSGAVLEANTNVPTGKGKSSSTEFDYWKLLDTPSRTMSRIQIPKIGVDLPIYHGTSEETLLKGAGHLQGTSLPVGGKNTRSVITAHRGLADATMFTDLDKIQVGDRFVVTTFGQVLTYQVIDTRVVDPEDTTTLRQQAGKDLVTLVTCTPLGINTHRILVTGQRITPTPPKDKEIAKNTRAQLQFPWWAVLYLGAIVLIVAYTWWAGRTYPKDAFPDNSKRSGRRRAPKRKRKRWRAP
jgi:sortase A